MLRIAHDAPVEAYLHDWLETTRRGGAVRRYHTVPTIGEQTVAAHSWGVAAIVHRISPDCRKEVLLAAIFHDTPEWLTGDTPADAKWREPRLKEVLDGIERLVHDSLGTGYEDELTPDERRTLKWADYIEILCFCVEQRRLGNQNMMLVWNRIVSWFSEREHQLTFPVRAILRDLSQHMWDCDDGASMAFKAEQTNVG